MPIKLSVLGATGKMGRRILQLGRSDPEFQIVGGFTTRSELGLQDLDVPLCTDASSAIALCDVAIDFTLPSATRAHLEAAILANKPLVIGTSGHSEEEKREIESAATKIPILFSPNFSLGIALCLEAVSKFSKALPKASTIKIIETHHIHKKDSPSGTALALACAIGEEKDVPIEAIRSGEVIGEHTVIFECGHERIELKHTAHSRDAFALGALLGAKFLSRQKPGLYSLKDLF